MDCAPKRQTKNKVRIDIQTGKNCEKLREPHIGLYKYARIHMSYINKTVQNRLYEVKNPTEHLS